MLTPVLVMDAWALAEASTAALTEPSAFATPA
ncbi:Uncharacterised protein [Mycobacteroides abscessus subsp. abscessus]|nr:Uncharacterised protein [Mycobacteroides abscessus subsp. abscessus]